MPHTTRELILAALLGVLGVAAPASAGAAEQVVIVPEPVAYGTPVTAPEIQRAGAAVFTSPPLGAATEARVELTQISRGWSAAVALSGRPREHNCREVYARPLGRLRALRGRTIPTGKFAAAGSRLGACLAFADTVDASIPITDAVRQIPCLAAGVRFTAAAQRRGGRSALRRLRTAEQPPVIADCTRGAERMTAIVRAPAGRRLAQIVGAHLRFGVLRSRADTTGGRVSAAFYRR